MTRFSILHQRLSGHAGHFAEQLETGSAAVLKSTLICRARLRWLHARKSALSDTLLLTCPPPGYPYTEAIIAKAIPLVAILKLRRITKITNDSIRAYFLRDALSRAVFPEEVALFLRDHPHMNLTSYDNEVRALADELRSAGWI